MSEAERPTRMRFSRRLKREETAASRGKLKNFLRHVAGRGKTYAMLQAAQQKLQQGTEVVIGVVETHGRKETEALTEGMPIIAAIADRISRHKAERNGS